VLLGLIVCAGGVARAQRDDGVPRVSAELLGGLAGGTVGGLFGATGGQTLGELLPGSPTLWTLAATLVLHNTGATWGTAATYRVFEGHRAVYADARKGAMLGDAALLGYAALVSPVLMHLGCGVRSWCGKALGVAAHLLPAIGASIAIERAPITPAR